jgi:LIVCS family branched-chain amino acid:cation transporter
MVYPSIVVLSVMTLFGEKIKNDNSFKFATYMALFISALNVLNSFGFNISIVNKLPFAGFGFGWIVPVIIAAIVGAYVGKKSIDKDVEELV